MRHRLPVVFLGIASATAELFAENTGIFLKKGDTILLPGGHMTGTVIATQEGGEPDGLDFNGDGKADMRLFATGRAQAVGAAAIGSTDPEFFIIVDEKGTYSVETKADGTGEKLSESKAEKLEIWKYGRISVTGGYLTTTYRLKDGVLAGPGGAVSYDRGFDDLNFIRRFTQGKRVSWIPGLRAELAYLQADQSLVQFSVISFSAGPLWFLPLISRHRGQFTAAFLAGMSMIKLRGPFFDVASNTLAALMALGYEYPFGRLALSLQVRNLIAYDTESPFVSFAATCGVVYSLY